MKRLMTLAAACLALAASTLTQGCSTAGNAVDRAAELGKAYYNQPNMAKVFEIEGTNLTLTVSGAKRLCLSTPVPVKQIIPREASWYDATADVLKTVAPWVFMGYLFHSTDLGAASSTTTVNNN